MKLITFANLANIDTLLNNKDLDHFDKVYSDGFLLTMLVNIFQKKKIIRRSFDFTSMAKEVIFNSSNERIIFCGGSANEIISFKKNLGAHKEKLWIFLDGYKEKSKLLPAISKYKPNVVILSLGSGLQEEFAIKIKQKYKSKEIIVYTSGAFISQTAIRKDYYPAIIDSLGLRWMYRELYIILMLEKGYFLIILEIFSGLFFDSKFRRRVLDLVS